LPIDFAEFTDSARIEDASPTVKHSLSGDCRPFIRGLRDALAECGWTYTQDDKVYAWGTVSILSELRAITIPAVPPATLPNVYPLTLQSLLFGGNWFCFYDPYRETPTGTSGPYGMPVTWVQWGLSSHDSLYNLIGMMEFVFSWMTFTEAAGSTTAPWGETVTDTSWRFLIAKQVAPHDGENDNLVNFSTVFGTTQAGWRLLSPVYDGEQVDMKVRMGWHTTTTELEIAFAGGTVKFAIDTANFLDPAADRSGFTIIANPHQFYLIKTNNIPRGDEQPELSAQDSTHGSTRFLLSQLWTPDHYPSLAVLEGGHDFERTTFLTAGLGIADGRGSLEAVWGPQASDMGVSGMLARRSPWGIRTVSGKPIVTNAWVYGSKSLVVASWILGKLWNAAMQSDFDGGTQELELGQTATEPHDWHRIKWDSGDFNTTRCSLWIY
jgi:hypothetical protein